MTFYYTPLGFQPWCTLLVLTRYLVKAFWQALSEKRGTSFSCLDLYMLKTQYVFSLNDVFVCSYHISTTCISRKDRTVSRQGSTNLSVYEFWPIWLMLVLEVSVLSMVHGKLATVMLCYKVVVMVRCLGCWPSLISLIFFCLKQEAHKKEHKPLHCRLVELYTMFSCFSKLWRSFH